MGILSVLWAIAVILFALWVLGLALHLAGGLIHLLLIVAAIIVVYNLIMHSRARGTL
jgi:hypothetical protein